ncbi:hypothetical protein BHE74_00027466 [Ensete ventricosum]|nr:hypothetical protein BHE74_00027466 [Ensete ventricosum]
MLKLYRGIMLPLRREMAAFLPPSPLAFRSLLPPPKPVAQFRSLDRLSSHLGRKSLPGVRFFCHSLIPFSPVGFGGTDRFSSGLGPKGLDSVRYQAASDGGSDGSAGGDGGYGGRRDGGSYDGGGHENDDGNDRFFLSWLSVREPLATGQYRQKLTVGDRFRPSAAD